MALADEHLNNLDGMWPDDLRDYAVQLRGLKLDGEDARTRDLLVGYARRKRLVMLRNIAGRLKNTVRLEKKCDSLYSQLPAYARW